MDFIVGLPKNQKGHDNIFVVVDRLTKHAHFIFSKSTMSIIDVAKLILHEFFCLHGLCKEIICDWDRNFINQFWGTLLKIFSTKLKMSNVDHNRCPNRKNQSYFGRYVKKGIYK